MSRYIDAKDLTDAFLEVLVMTMTEQERTIISKIIKIIDDVPTADVAPIVHAHWIKGPNNIYCSHCGAVGHCGNYCDYCGAKMDEKGE